MRNALSKVPYRGRAALASSYLKQIYNSPTKLMAISIVQLIAREYQNSYPKSNRLLEEELESTLTYLKQRSKAILHITGERSEPPV